MPSEAVSGGPGLLVTVSQVVRLLFQCCESCWCERFPVGFHYRRLVVGGDMQWLLPLSALVGFWFCFWWLRCLLCLVVEWFFTGYDSVEGSRWVPLSSSDRWWCFVMERCHLTVPV